MSVHLQRTAEPGKYRCQAFPYTDMAVGTIRLDVGKAHGVRMKVQTRAKKAGTNNTLFVALKDDMSSWDQVTPDDENRAQAAASKLVDNVKKNQDTGYGDVRLLAGSHLLRHKLPPVNLSRSNSAPASRHDDFTTLTSLKVDAQTYGPPGSRLVAVVRASIGKEKIAQALNDGNMTALRAAVRGAQFGPRDTKMHSDPSVQRGRFVLAKYDKILRECRDGIAERDMIRLQTAMNDLDSLAEMNLGPHLMDDPILKKACLWLAKWTPFRPYLFKLEQSWFEGPKRYALYWIVVMEGRLLSPELEKIATDDLASLGEEGEDALEEAFDRPELRYHYSAPWTEKNIVLEQVRERIANMGFDVEHLKFRLAQDKVEEGSMAELSVVIAGPETLVDDVRRRIATRAVEGIVGEPRAGERTARLDTAEQRRLRRNAHRERLEASIRLLDEGPFSRSVDTLNQTDFLSSKELAGSSSSLSGTVQKTLKAEVLGAAVDMNRSLEEA